jgi:hypothetical protein
MYVYTYEGIGTCTCLKLSFMTQVGSLSKALDIRVNIKQINTIIFQFFSSCHMMILETSSLFFPISLRILFYQLFPSSCVLNIYVSKCSNTYHLRESNQSTFWPLIDFTFLSIAKHLGRIIYLMVYISPVFYTFTLL